MESEKPIQPKNGETPGGLKKQASWWPAHRVCIALALLFGVVFAASWWLTPVQPYATLIVNAFGISSFSFDSKMLVTTGESFLGYTHVPVRIWEVSLGLEQFSIAADRKAIKTAQFSPDNNLLAAHEQEEGVKLWDTKTGREIASIGPKTRFGTRAFFQFSPDGRFLVFQDISKGMPDKAYVTFWNIETQQEQATVDSGIDSLAFAKDGHTIATFRRKADTKVNEVLLWKMDQVPVLMKQHQVTASVVAFSPDLMSFATTEDVRKGSGEVVMYDMATGEKRWALTFKKHDMILQTLTFKANGKILALYGGDPLNGNQRTTLWDLTSAPKEIGSFSKTPAVSPDGEWLAIPLASGAKLVKVAAYAPDQGTDLVVKSDSLVGFPVPSFSTDSKMVVIEGLHRISQKPFFDNWLPEKFNPFRGDPMRRDPNTAVVRVWDVDSCREMLMFSKCILARFSPDGKSLATFRDDGKAIDLWRMPLRNSFWRIFIWAVFVWLVVILVCGLAFKTRKKMLSR